MSDLPLGPLHTSGIESLRKENSDLKRVLAGTQYRAEALEKENVRMKAALEKIADPRKRDHKEPDAYTELGCVMNIASEALDRESSGQEPKTVADKGSG